MSTPRTYTIEILGVVYTYKGANRRQLSEALQLSEQFDMEDYICKVCVISPEIDFDSVLAGIPTRLSEAILESSGMNDNGTNLFQSEAQEWIISSSGKLEALMMGVFHQPLDVIQELEPHLWYKMACSSQLVAASMYGLDIKQFMEINPFEEPKKVAGKAKPPAVNNPSGRVIPPMLMTPND